jgi:hypothetical protein
MIPMTFFSSPFFEEKNNIFPFFLLVEIISITYFSDPVGQSAITKNKRVYDKIRITSLSFLGESGQGLFLAPIMTNTIPLASATPPKMGDNGMVFLVSWVAWMGPISMIFSRLV